MSVPAVEFIAGHSLQAQCAESVFTELSRLRPCRWRVGRRLPYEGGRVAVLIDHTSNHPNVIRSWRRYRQVFFMLHDLGDVDVYQREKKRLQKFSAVLVPNALHAARATAALGMRVDIVEVGWPKYDALPLSSEHAMTLAAVQGLPQEVPTVMYAPNCPGEAEWDSLWAVLRNLPVNLIIKNATYDVGPGEALPEHYRRIIRTIDRMEREVQQSGKPHAVITPRDLNICTLFPHVDVVLSTKSSVLAEFLPFGVSIEADMPWPRELSSALISRDYIDVVCVSPPVLIELLGSIDRLRRFMADHPARLRQPEALCRYPNRSMSAGRRAAESITRRMYAATRA